MNTYVIRNNAGDYWSNEFGWTEFYECATIFTGGECNDDSLPCAGGDIAYWEETQTSVQPRAERERVVALVSPQGTACAETALHGTEDTPSNRADVESRYCHGESDDPICGSWCDVSENDAISKQPR